jgi:DNA-binding CsgD family transcriptional regulator
MRRCLGAAADKILPARGDPARLKRVLCRSPMPMVIVDDDRRYVDANTPARLALGLSLAELLRFRIDDLTPRDQLPELEVNWARFIEAGSTTVPCVFVPPGGARLDATLFGVANALPGRHAGAFVPARWPDGELLDAIDATAGTLRTSLTPREREVLELAADGCSGPAIARELFVSSATVRTHFEHIYKKLAVSDRAAAVAKAIRLGIIS